MKKIYNIRREGDDTIAELPPHITSKKFSKTSRVNVLKLVESFGEGEEFAFEALEKAMHWKLYKHLELDVFFRSIRDKLGDVAFAKNPDALTSTLGDLSKMLTKWEEHFRG